MNHKKGTHVQPFMYRRSMCCSTLSITPSGLPLKNPAQQQAVHTPTLRPCPSASHHARPAAQPASVSTHTASSPVAAPGALAAPTPALRAPAFALPAGFLRALAAPLAASAAASGAAAARAPRALLGRSAAARC